MNTKELQNELIEAIDGCKRITKEAEEILNKVMDMGVYSITTLNGIKLVSWSDGSWEDISAMLEAHYRGDIDITEYWKTGDTRTILVNDIFVDFILIGNNHDDLVNPIASSKKAAFTVQTKYCFGEKKMFDNFMTPTFSLWCDSLVRSYLNIEFKTFLPKELQSIIKPVKKNTYRHGADRNNCKLYEGSTTTHDSIFLLSEMEVYGEQSAEKSSWGRDSDGTQYEYYKDVSNRIKYPEPSYTSGTWWWLRSSYVDDCGNSAFRFVGTRGNIKYGCANHDYAIAPAFCI